MGTGPLEYEIAKRAQNFRWDSAKLEKQAAENARYFFQLTILKDMIVRFCETAELVKRSEAERLEMVFSKIYDGIEKSEAAKQSFCELSPFKDDVYEAYKFTTLCSFLHASKRIKGKTLRNFVYQNHPLGFNDSRSPNYRDPNLISVETEKLRKSRTRLLSNGRVYIKNIQWNAMSKDAEYEWTFYYALERAEPIVQDTFKRIGNLYNGLDKVLDTNKDDEYEGRVQNAYKKFLAKLRKIEYENYLKLQKVVLSHICEDKKYYGLNLYRLERRLKTYAITNDVNRLLKCQSTEEEADLLLKTVALNDICFPKIYNSFSREPLSHIESYAAEFLSFLRDITASSCLIIDELVEKGFFGDDWESLFLDTVNKMADDVLYIPGKIDFSTTEKSQEKFVRLLNAVVFVDIHLEADTPFCANELLI